MNMANIICTTIYFSSEASIEIEADKRWDGDMKIYKESVLTTLFK